jgi:hypothetical protein
MRAALGPCIASKMRERMTDKKVEDRLRKKRRSR